MKFSDLDILLDRLDGAHEPVLILGSALCMPVVPGVAEMTRLVEAAATRPRLKRRIADALQAVDHQGGGAADRYQAALQALIDGAGLSAANAVIQQAVLQACTGPTPVATRATEDDSAHWRLTPGLTALGRWIAGRTDRVTVLTTNFDPLIEVAIRQAGGQCFSTVLTVDGRLQASHGQGAHIVHVHGHWLDDTLHTPEQLAAPRGYLHQSLQTACRGRLVAVLAYGGWDDAITRALWDLAHDAAARTDILWTFYSDDAVAIARQAGHIFQGLKPVVPGRTFFFKGVDVHAVLPQLVVDQPAAPGIAAPGIAAPAAPTGLPLSRAAIEEIVQWALKEGLPDRRAVLMGALPTRFVGHLRMTAVPLDQLWLDLMALNDPELRDDDDVPLMARWLAQAAAMAIRPACQAGFERLHAQVTR